MRNLLAIWRAHGLDALLREAWRARASCSPGSAPGAMCWFEGGITTLGRAARGRSPGLGLLPGSLSVHADGEPERLPVWLDAVRTGALPGGWAADDGVGLLFEGTRADARRQLAPGHGRAARATRSAASSCGRRLEPELLGAGPLATRPLPDDIKEWRRTRYGRRGTDSTNTNCNARSPGHRRTNGSRTRAQRGYP